MPEVIGRVSNRVFLGLPMCKKTLGESGLRNIICVYRPSEGIFEVHLGFYMGDRVEEFCNRSISVIIQTVRGSPKIFSILTS